MRDKILKVVLECLEEAVEELDEAPQAAVGKDTMLFGDGGLFDSLGLVSFIVDVEGQLLDDLDLEVNLSNRKALSKSRTPFSSASAFTDFIVSLLEEDE